MSWKRDEPRHVWQWMESGVAAAEVSDAMLARADPHVRRVLEACFASRLMPPMPELLRVTRTAGDEGGGGPVPRLEGDNIVKSWRYRGPGG